MKTHLDRTICPPRAITNNDNHTNNNNNDKNQHRKEMKQPQTSNHPETNSIIRIKTIFFFTIGNKPSIFLVNKTNFICETFMSVVRLFCGVYRQYEIQPRNIFQFFFSFGFDSEPTRRLN